MGIGNYVFGICTLDANFIMFVRVCFATMSHSFVGQSNLIGIFKAAMLSFMYYYTAKFSIYKPWKKNCNYKASANANAGYIRSKHQSISNILIKCHRKFFF